MSLRAEWGVCQPREVADSLVLLEAGNSPSAGHGYRLSRDVHVALLLQIARNLVRSHRQMREDFSRHVVVEPSGVTIESDDESLLTQVVDVVEAHLGDSQFTIDVLADEVGLSRRQLQRRLPGLCGESPSQLVRRMRLERARQLLEANVGAVSEIAYAAGYRSPSHFTAAFRRRYGTSPSEYRRSNGKD